MRIDENEVINIWLAGNTGLRNPMRIQEGFIAFSQSPYVGNLHGNENEMGFMKFLDDKGIIKNESGKDLSGSHARKWRLMFERYGFIYVDRDETDLRQCRRYRKDSFYWYQKVIRSNGTEL